MRSTLPIELVTEIIRLTLPSSLTFSDFSERNADLCRFTLVDKSWRAIARPELYRHVRLNRKENVVSMVASHKKRELDILLSRATTLWIGGSTGLTEEGYAPPFEPFTAVVMKCRSLSQLFVSRLSMESTDFIDLQAIPNLVLHRITLRSYSMSQSLRVYLNPLPYLTHLTLVNPTLDPSFGRDWSPLFHPQVLSGLKHLSITADDIEMGEFSMFDQPVAWVAPQLESFVYVQGAYNNAPNLDEIWYRFSSLKRLHLHVTDWLEFDMLDTLPVKSLDWLSFGNNSVDNMMMDAKCQYISELLDEVRVEPFDCKAIGLLGWSLHGQPGKPEQALWYDKLCYDLATRKVKMMLSKSVPTCMEVAPWDEFADCEFKMNIFVPSEDD